ncbi:hypothetical protein BST95_02900 [Halioglobus japonicus]|uniref:UrcA family protein n=1 Tax=Halioglobus japonicus TaxID=930805 RepID=A0AAP8MCY8_9GAMM|nr:UrcA family protein [Halioglobus japonicus]AQA17331.1 hypothetical protein BST95_02900 [Halioglobus japonicus]PLW85252.1 UrcA family protein [Halioglobus japonicus]GHD24166.1 hypothetical protein GCM10007052_37600 [Halioglobus japonicus]
MNRIVTKNILSAAAIAVTAGLSFNVAAENIDETLVEASQVPSKSVSFTRAELATEEGRLAVENRIREAAEDVCGPMDYHRAGGLAGVADSRECLDNAVDAAMSQIGADQVAAID